MGADSADDFFTESLDKKKDITDGWENIEFDKPEQIPIPVSIEPKKLPKPVEPAVQPETTEKIAVTENIKEEIPEQQYQEQTQVGYYGDGSVYNQNYNEHSYGYGQN